MTIVSTAISYIFASLAFHPDLGQVKGANGVTQVLGFGMIVVTPLFPQPFLIYLHH
jgi:putative ABC transport system permease protein